MNTNISTAAAAVVTFVVTLILNTAINLYSSDKGKASVGRAVTIGAQTVVIVSIENHSDDFIESLSIEIPKSAKLSEVTSDSPLKIESSTGLQATQAASITIGKLPPRAVSRVFIPLPSESEAQHVRILNAKAVGLNAVSENNLDSPFRLALLSGGTSAFFYALFFALVRHQQKNDHSALDAKIKGLKADLDAARGHSDKNREDFSIERQSLAKEVAEMRSVLTKQRVLLMARLSDYARELDFWRNAIKQILLKPGVKPNDVNSVFEHVTTTLQTYSTNGRTPNFDSIRVAAGWLAENSSKSHE